MKRDVGRHDKEIESLKRMKDAQIDFTDIPLKTDWSRAVVAKFYRPIKKSLTIRVDADVLAWLKSHGKGYQTRINAILRAAMESAAPGFRPSRSNRVERGNRRTERLRRTS